MANKAKTTSTSERDDTAFAVRLLIKAVFTVGVLLLLLSLLSYHAEDTHILAGGIGPHGNRINNWIGPFGAMLSGAWIRWIGLAAYPATILLLLCITMRLARRQLRPVTGVYFAAVFTSVFGLSLLLGNFPGFLSAAAAQLNIAETPGGVLGQRFCEPWLDSSGGWLSYVVHPTGCIIISVAMIVVGLTTIGYFDWRGDWWRRLLRRKTAKPARTAKKKRDKPAELTIEKPVEIEDSDAAVFKGEAEPEWAEADPHPEPEMEVLAAGAEADAPTELEKNPEPEPPLPDASAAWPEVPGPAPTARPGRQSPRARINPIDYKLPTPQLLKQAAAGKNTKAVTVSPKEIATKKEILQETLDSFGIDGTVGETTSGPRVTLFEIKPAAGVRVEKISSLQNNIAMALKAESLRIMTPIPGRDTVGIEVPNATSAPVTFRELVEHPMWLNSKATIPIALGKDISGQPVILDLSEAPHLLIAGATGSGKSVCMNSLILSLLFRFRPDELKLIMVDPKVVEFKGYGSLPHLVSPVVSEPQKVPVVLRWTLSQMEWRYQVLSKAGVRNVASYNSRKIPDEPVLDDEGNPIPDSLPYLVVIIDELADIIMTAKAEVETALARIAQKARAIGIHTVIATQRPSVNIITGIIKANFPTRIAFQVTSLADSRTILDGKGAETLLGRGDALFKSPRGARLSRTQGALTADEDIERVVDFVSAQAEPAFIDEIFSTPDLEGLVTAEAAAAGGGEAPTAETSAFVGAQYADAGSSSNDSDEELVQRAIQIILHDRRATTSHIQRKLRIGYNRASLVIETLEERGIVGPQVGTAPRQILIDEETVAATGADN
ncbi:MAG: DNA translocase FtsK 4TM domain-containing protein [Lentisphaeria bacterium]|jgi:S-DNA-T family DNA segregation ATPase FtsK/SpoIIIE|nr:DNA translocase FtsK 4TM domain-containing protein [Lentisphaeria bacterium]MDP7742462.1 DNA translocase FtsK 4TM domain-containing protein [Lentisphaeria bacterium]